MPTLDQQNSVLQTPTLASLAGAGLQPVADYVVPAEVNVLRVGAGKPFTSLAAALAASRNGDTILVDAGTYINDFATVSTKVSIIGVGGMVNLVATAQPANGKAILCVDTDCVIQNVSFSGCTVPDANGAGIRYEGGDLTLRNCSFHDNENGLMSAPVRFGTLLVQNCDFGHNGNGNGLTHNLYAGGIKQLVIENSRFHDAVVGHEIKSRALSTTITGCVISDDANSTASYSIDLPNGGKAVVQGNVIEKGPLTENNAIIHFGGEGIPYAGSSLLVTDNQVTNDRASGIGVLNHTAIAVTVSGNSFTRLDLSNIVRGPVRITGNLDSPGADGTGKAIADAVLSGVVPGAGQVFTDAADHQVTMTRSDTTVQGGAGRLQVLAQAGHVTVQGGSGGLDFAEVADSGGNQVATAAGTTNTITLTGQSMLDSQGTDSIITGAGNVTVQVSGTAAIQEGAANNQWSVLGSAHLTGHGGAPRINLGEAASVALDGAFCYFAIGSNGGTATYDMSLGGLPVQATLSGGGYSMWGAEGHTSIKTSAGGGVQLQLGAGDVELISAGSDTVWAGSGTTMVQASGPAEVHAGEGALSMFSRGWSGATLWGNGGTYLISGDTGGITYYGGDKDSTVDARLSHITLLGGAGQMTVHAGYNQSIVGGAGGLVVTEGAESGGNSITTQAGTRNAISLTNGTLESRGQDTITQPAGNNHLAIYGTATIQGSPNNSGITVYGQATLLGQGGDWVSVRPGATADLTAGTGLFVTVERASVRITVPGGAAPDATASIGGAGAYAEVLDSRLLRISTANDATTGGAGTDVTVDCGNSQIYSYGADRIHTGAGTAWVALSANSTEVWGGSGQLAVSNYNWTPGSHQTIHGGDGSVRIEGGGSDITFIGGAGDAVLDGSGRSLTIQGGAGRITVANPWAQALTFTGGAGDASLNLGTAGGTITFGTGHTEVSQAQWSAPVTYTLAPGGTQAINGFRPGTDILRIAGAGVASQSIGDGATTLVTTAGASLVLLGVDAPVSPALVPALPQVPAVSSTDQVQLAHAALATATPSPDPAASGTPAPETGFVPSAALAAPVDAVAVPAVADPAPPPATATTPATATDASPANAPATDAAVVPMLPPIPGSSAAPATSPLASIPVMEAAPSPDAAQAHQPASDAAVAPALPPSQSPDALPAIPGLADATTTGTAAAAPLPDAPAASLTAPVAGSTGTLAAQPSTAAPVPQAAVPDAVPAPAAQPVTPSAAFAVLPSAGGPATYTDEAYTGPVASLQRQFIWSGDNGVVVAAGIPDVFLHGGGGDDALAAQGGSNVLDGGAGSNFLVGGADAAGADTFFVDGRGGETWSTLVNFHHGDALTLWGYQPGVSTSAWAGGGGAAGYTGATIHAELGGAGTGVNASATFAGLTLDDVQSKLTVSSGAVGGLSYLNVAYTG